MKRLVTQYHALNILELARGSYLHPFSRYDWVWRTHKGTQQTSVSIAVLNESLQLVYLLGPNRILQDVRLTYSLGARGGKRPWFVCPQCQQRVGVLYHADRLPFRCRTCNDLAYPTQYPSHDQSYGRQPRRLSRQAEQRLRQQCAAGT
ncbi:MAG: hypothetical protein ABIQ24_03690 [Nitrospiraceae bacterium]